MHAVFLHTWYCAYTIYLFVFKLTVFYYLAALVQALHVVPTTVSPAQATPLQLIGEETLRAAEQSPLRIYLYI
jgi:hypothetical protein